MKKMLAWLDWTLLIRVLMGLPFLWMSYVYRDWLPALFGITIISTGIIAHYTKTGCGYPGGCANNTSTPN
jgi:hypothetical protein